MAICKNCKGVGYIIAEDRCSSYHVECWECDGKGVVEPMTEQEWLQTCNTEQLADVLNKIFMTRTFCHICPEGDVCDIGHKCKYSGGGKIEDWVEWLKEKHK